MLTLREAKLANGNRRESASVVVGYGKRSLMRKVERVTEMRDPGTGVRTGGMRECRDHLMLRVIALISSVGTTLSQQCWIAGF